MAFNGTWKIDRNENYEKLMEAMGVNVMKRKLGLHDNLKMTIQQDGNKFIIKESSNFRTLDIEFTLGVNFEYSLPDGTEVSGSWNIEGNKLEGSFTRKDNGKVLQVCREIVGDELVQTSVYEGVEAKRIFKRGRVLHPEQHTKIIGPISILSELAGLRSPDGPSAMGGKGAAETRQPRLHTTAFSRPLRAERSASCRRRYRRA
ncbi:fatty acid-binding protein, intestinal [Indicator indicator]|uniref:fatty acid-binding protein, intestinal n=1 Tax=Indicator indicator TaxID=1002788 RepID=UPI0023DEB28B|nr:fatty acid-binding protein, intestinal [Indicator indicator]